MKKSFVAALLFVVSTASVFGQFTPPIDTVFTENFDGILAADSIAANYNTDSLNVNRSWNDTSFLSTTGSNSFHTQIYVADSIIFETDAFSTVTNTNVRLTFDHICKIRYDQKAYVQISRDDGATWVNITGSQYKGESPQFPGQGWFNELSYPSAILSPFWEGPTIGGSNSGVTPNAGWWARETFDLGSYLGAFDPVNNQDGFAQCKIRFIMTNKTGFGPPNSLSGWFIDNIMVEAAPCELEPPIIDWLNVSQPAQPTGARYMPTQDVRFKGQDNIGVDSSKIYFRRYDWSAGAWTNWRDSLMTPSNTNSCPNASDFAYTFSGISVNDTIEWYVQIFDCACPNIVRSPLETAANTTFKFWREPSLPAICGVTTPSTFPLASTLPFTEDFEDPVYWVAGSGAGISGTAHRGSWPSQNPTLGKNFNVIPTQNTIGYAWSIRIGQTSSLQTGPNGDASSSITGKYIYTEASQGNNNNVTHMKPPCVNLSNLTCALLEFDYHMYGSEIN